MKNTQSNTIKAEHPLSNEMLSATQQAFGNVPIDSVSVLSGGRSGASLFRVTLDGTDYVLRKVDPNRPMHKVRAEQERICMTIAAERGIAPKAHYFNIDSGIVITEHIDGVPLGRSAHHINRIAGTLRHLHNGPAFPIGLGITTLVSQIDAYLQTQMDMGLPNCLTSAVEEVAQITARFAQSAPCHNDMNPTNILETPQAIYFLDWEWACMSDPFLDLAQLGIFSFPMCEQREKLLEAYLERRPTEEECARMTMARVMALGVYSAGFSQVAASKDRYESQNPTVLSMPGLLAYLGSQGEHAAPEVVAASLLNEMLCERETDSYADAKRTLSHPLE